MTKFLKELHNDKSGAAFIEYTALLGVILAVGLATLGAVGSWAGATWTGLCNKLVAANGVASCTSFL